MTAKPNTASRKPGPRGSVSKKKPVTIELEAEKVKTSTRETSAKTSAKPSGSDNMKTTAKSTAKTSAAGGGSTFGLGRDAAKATSGTSTEGGSLTSKLVAGIVGGIIALGGGYALQFSGLLPSPSAQTAGLVTQDALKSSSSEINTKIAALEAKLAERDSNETVDQAGVEAAIDARLAALPKVEPDAALREQLDVSTTENNAKVADLQARLDKTASALDSLQSSLSSGEAGDAAALASLTTRMESLSGELTGLRDDVTKLNGGVTLAEIAAMGTSLGDVSGKVGKLETGLSDMRSRTDALPKEVADLSAVTAIASELEKVKSTAQALQLKLGGQQETLAAVQSKLDNGADKKAARALAAVSLKSDIDRGLPFSNSLGILKSFSGDGDGLEALESYANKGIPSETVLADRFDAVKDAVISATTQVQKKGSFSRLVAGAKSFVKVKTLAPQEGDTPAAILSRIGASVAFGDLEKATAEWKTLPPAGQTASADWHKDLQARLAANSIVANTVQKIMQISPISSGTGN